jgi:PAS domain S-box-containing protein
MWGTQPEVQASSTEFQTKEEATPFLLVGAPCSDLADLAAILASLGQPMHKAAPWSDDLVALLDEGLACIIVDSRRGWAVGFAAAHHLRGYEQARHIPLLFLGERSCGEADLLRGYGLGKVDCLLEPFHPDILRSKVGILIESQQRERRMREALARAEQAESATRDSERTLRTLLGNLPGVAYRRHNTHGYPFAYISEGALLLTGYSPEDFTSRRVLWEQLIHPRDVQRVWDEVQTAVSARMPFTLTYRLRTRTGEERWVRERGVALDEPGNELPMLEGFITDITPLHRAELEQARLLTQMEGERNLLHTILQQLPCAVHVAEAPSGRTLHDNARLKQLLGHSLLETQSVKDFAHYHAVHPDGRRYTAEEYPLARVLATGRAQPEEDVLYSRPDGSTRVLHISAGPIRDNQGRLQAAVASFMDVTSLKYAEQHQSFLASVSETLASSLDYEDTLAHVVQRAVPELGDGCTVDLVEPDGSVRRLAVSHVDPDRAEVLWELSRRYPIQPDDPFGLAAVISTGRTELRAEYTDDILVQYARDEQHLELLRKLGLQSTLMVPLYARGRIFGALCFFYSHAGPLYGWKEQLLAEDLGRRAALAVDNARLYREAHLAVQLRDEFLSVASHELKTPLTPLHLKLNLLSRELSQSNGEQQTERLQRHVEVARRQVHKMSTLINALLDVSRLSQGKLKLEPSDMDLGEVVGEVVAWFAPEAARTGSALRVEGERRVPGWWDRLRLEQVVTNLISNAIRYGAGRPIGARVEVEGDRARLVVHDEGIGVPPESLERIFGKFERAVSDRHSGGLGLGLYITRSIVEAMGGSIRVESHPGEGSTFTVELPRSRPPDSPP